MNQHASARGRLKQGFSDFRLSETIKHFLGLHSMQMKNSGVQASLPSESYIGPEGLSATLTKTEII